LRQVSPARVSVDAGEKHCQPTQLDVGADAVLAVVVVGADAVLAVVVDGAQPEAGFAVAPAALDGDELPSRLRRFVSRKYTPTSLAHIQW
jgi:hypothetical protein